MNTQTRQTKSDRAQQEVQLRKVTSNRKIPSSREIYTPILERAGSQKIKPGFRRKELGSNDRKQL